MRTLIGAILPVILVILVLLVIFGLSFTIIGGLAIGLGHLLMRILPLSLFEATVLSMAFAIITIYLMIRIGSLLSPSGFTNFMEDEAEDEEGEAEYMRIPTTRFYKTGRERTWEAWLRAEIADDIYVQFQGEPNSVLHLGEIQRQELAIRLSDAALSILKRKRKGRGRLTINMSTLKRELSRMGQQAYDDHIMHLAVDAINMNLDFYSPVLNEVIRTQAWNELADVPEE